VVLNLMLNRKPTLPARLGVRVRRVLSLFLLQFRSGEGFFSVYLEVTAISLRRFPRRHRRAGRAVFDYADFIGKKRARRLIPHSTIYL